MQHSRKVIFIGAGPGDPELLTVKAVLALQKADVVITDRLVSEDLISQYVPHTAQVIAVGKQGGSGLSTSQEEINEMLVTKAQHYNQVVRLKGGDISIFSNILDELLALIKAGIPYELIPGITALSGAAAYTGIPLTARGFATGVRVLTFYKNTIISSDSWKDMAALNDTLVFYMSGASLPEVVDNLLLHGALPDTPFVVIEQATTPRQFVHSFTLAQYAAAPHPGGFISPALVMVGKVTHLYKHFAWLPNNNERTPHFSPLDNLTELFNEIKKWK